MVCLFIRLFYIIFDWLAGVRIGIGIGIVVVVCGRIDDWMDGWGVAG
jgi:hypothetical protein